MNDAPLLSHVPGHQPGMVDVGHKAPTMRMAIAQALMTLPHELTKRLAHGDFVSKKGPIFQTAIIAATMAVKKTSDLIPLCHPISIEDVKVTLDVVSAGKIAIQVSVKSLSKTGVEMEALHGASVAALTVYDMVKSYSLDMEIVSIKLLEKSGGKRDFKSNA